MHTTPQHQSASSPALLVGDSRPMQALWQIIRKVGPTDANVLLTGESGTGKDLVARALHAHSHRSDQSMVKVDMGAISPHLFESEMFGHKKGAFTDARQDRDGRFTQAHGGTLFLDEIANLSPQGQQKLLVALQQRRVTPLGANLSHEVDIRLICATNVGLADLVAKKRFRSDLRFRINTVEIYLPPLRERKEDIPLLSGHFLKFFAEKHQREHRPLTDAALRHLLQHEWPGNVRELEHAIERAVIMSEGREIGSEAFRFHPAARPREGMYLETLHLDTVERLVIQRALEKHAGNISQAARELGLTRTSLYRRLEKYGMKGE
ncbi:MAG: sigma-54 dependent transcriptional regulator [Bacteroidota bacterium]